MCYTQYNVSVKHNIFITCNVILRRHVSTPSESSSGPLKVHIQGTVLLRGPEDDSEGVETCRPKITFYVIKTVVFDALYFICIDEHIGMTNIKFQVSVTIIKRLVIH